MQSVWKLEFIKYANVYVWTMDVYINTLYVNVWKCQFMYIQEYEICKWLNMSMFVYVSVCIN